MCFSSPSVILTSPNSTVETTGAGSTRTPISPSAILATTRFASPSKTISSGVMIRQKSCRPSATLAYLPGLADLSRGGRLLVLPGLLGLLGLPGLPGLLGIFVLRRLLFPLVLLGLALLFGPFFLLFAAQAPGLLDSLIYVADEVEGLLGKLIVPTLDDLLERADRVLKLDKLALEAGELLGDEERLREEALEPARPAHDDLVLLGELVDAEDGDDVLELFVALQDVLYLLGYLVVLVADHRGVEDRRGGGQRVHRGVDALLGEAATELDRRVEVGEDRERCGVGEVVGRDVDCLEARYGALLGRGDAFLESTHLGAERRLVADLRWHPAHEGGDLVARLHEAEDVVHEKEHVLPELLAEVLRDRDAREADAEACAGRLVHLAEDERHVPEHPGLLELAVEVVPLAGALADAGEDTRTLVLQGDVVDQLGDNDRLADARAAEETNLAAPPDRAEEVHDLDAGDELLGLGGEILETRGGAVDRPVVLRGLDRALLVHRLAEDVQHPPEDVISHGDGYGVARVVHVQAATEAIRGGHRHGADHIVAEELLDLEGQLLLLVVHLELHGKGVVGLGDVLRAETNVHDGTLDLYDGPDPALAALRPAVALRLLLCGLPVRAAVLGTSL